MAKASPNSLQKILKSKTNQTECLTSMTELKKVYWFEKQLLIAIPMLLRSATTFELVDSLTMLVQYTRDHVKRLEKKFPKIGLLDIIIKKKKE